MHRLLAPYLAILAPERSWRFSLAGWFGRLSRSTTGIATVLLISVRSDGYALAGAVAGAIVLGIAVASPLWARAMDRRGQTAVLPLALVASAVAATGMLLVVDLSAPRWTWFLAAALVGATSIDTGALVRSRWMSRLHDEPSRHTALSLEGVLDELVYVIGPPFVTLVATLVAPELRFATGIAATLAGGVSLLLQRDSAPVPAAVGAAAVRWMPRGVAGVLPIYLGVGLLFGGIDLAVVGVARSEGTPALAGVILAVFAIGSVVGGVVFGPLSGRWRAMRRVVIAAVAFALVVPALLLAPNAGVLAALILSCGLVTAPVLIAGASYIAATVDRGEVTTAMAWPSVALAIGVTIGAAVAGVVVDAAGPHAGFLVTTSAALLVGLAGLAQQLRHPPAR